MNILAALRQEEEKWKRQAEQARQQLETVQGAIKLLGGKPAGTKKKGMSATARKRMSRAAKKRWAKVKAAKKASKS